MQSKKEGNFYLWRRHSIADSLVFSKLRAFFRRQSARLHHGARAFRYDYLIFTGAGIATGRATADRNFAGRYQQRVLSQARHGRETIRNVQIRTAPTRNRSFGTERNARLFNKPRSDPEAFTRTAGLKRRHRRDFRNGSADHRRKKELSNFGRKYIAPSPIEQMIKTFAFRQPGRARRNEQKFPAARSCRVRRARAFCQIRGLDRQRHGNFAASAVWNYSARMSRLRWIVAL